MGMVSKYTVSCWEEVSIQMGNHKYKLLPTITFGYILQADLKPLRGLGPGLMFKTLTTQV